MQLLPTWAKELDVVNTTVEFYTYEENGMTIYYFDSSVCSPPGPMVNAMAGLKLLDENSKLIMINHHAPEGLFPKIKENYEYTIEELEDGRVKIEFTYKKGTKIVTDFNDNQCSGG